jgi:endonuclease/exonuclease/phosphatase (EEP) superfamily protein YafD
MATPFSFARSIGWFFRSVFWSLNLLVAFYTLLLYGLLYFLPIEHWSASMLLITLPIAWAFNIGFGLVWLWARRWQGLLSAITLLAGFWLFPRTYAHNASAVLPGPATFNKPYKKQIKLLSYNVMEFNLLDFLGHENKSLKAQQMTDWVIKTDADVKCFQEFYNGPNYPVFRMIDRFRRAGYVYSAWLKQGNPDVGFKGVATFSRFPIVASGQEIFSGGFNGLVWTDVAVGTDTIRIINVHLHSMGIRVGKVVRQDEMTGVKHETKGILKALKDGFAERHREVHLLENYIAISPYPVIVTGDFNETPYSVVYERMRRKLRNSFEDAGRGFGFSYNKPPGFIRIDNQFYGPPLQPLNFETLTSISYSDHYPILGIYSF